MVKNYQLPDTIALEDCTKYLILKVNNVTIITICKNDMLLKRSKQVAFVKNTKTCVDIIVIFRQRYTIYIY